MPAGARPGGKALAGRPRGARADGRRAGGARSGGRALAGRLRRLLQPVQAEPVVHAGGRALAGRLRRLLLPGDSAVENALFLALILAGATVRLLWLGEVPGGVHQDEASVGYDAWALLEHGIDRHGYRYPVQFVAWGSGQDALYGYLSMPFIKLLGLNLLSIRLLHAILGVAALFVMYAVGRRLVDGRFALCALFVLVISPWHVMLSRWGSESNLLPVLLLFGFALLLRGLRTPRYMVPAFLLLALALYAYKTAYVFVPLFTLGVLAYGMRRRLADFRHWGLGLAAMAAAALPIGLFLAVNLFDLPAVETPLLSIPRLTSTPSRLTAETVFFADDPLRRIAVNAWRAFKIVVVDGHAGGSIPAFGYFYNQAGLGVTLAGACFMVRDLAQGRRPENVLVLLWLAAGGATAAAAYGYHMVRLNVLFFPLLLCAAYGLHGAFPRIRAWRTCRGRAGRWIERTANVLCVAALAYLTLSFAAFTRHYFFIDWGPGRFYADSSYAAALAHVIRHADPDDAIYMPESVHYTIPLFYDPPDPRLFLKTVEFEALNVAFQGARSYGRYRFGMDGQAVANGNAFVIRGGEAPTFPASDFVVTPFGRWAAAIRRR